RSGRMNALSFDFCLPAAAHSRQFARWGVSHPVKCSPRPSRPGYDQLAVGSRANAAYGSRTAYMRLATNRFSFLTILAVLMLALSPQAFAADGGTRASEFKLGNGMDVVVIPDHRAPVVTHMVWYKVGAADEVAGTSGIAHFL